MKRYVRSTFVACAVALCVIPASGAAAHEATAEYPGSQVAAPDCVRFTADWRYTFVTNDCSSAYSVTVVYGDGNEVPCRWANPGDMLTFPGYGTRGNEVLGAVLCATDGSALPGGA
ncbi:hypothetical protein J2X68_005149 [Streptomyces sp. 3330]|uniref:alpha-amylase n=1 Tax=Streptomyces sp. 3330 TaxID=2817755 RepID=UPI002854D298|nr:alpha-amylase [Streptomyces sp. 3330]MDR6978423.1 hypothetical protein [Streptomyces sp. 3330]